MKKVLGIFLVIGIALFLMGCGKTDLEAVEESLEVVVEELEEKAEELTWTEEELEEEEEEGVREIEVTLKEWEFDPAEIKVAKGDKVKLVITSEDLDGGLAIGEFKVNERVAPGETVEAEFEANLKGKFLMYCPSPCGVGTSSMKGWLTVE